MILDKIDSKKDENDSLLDSFLPPPCKIILYNYYSHSTPES